MAPSRPRGFGDAVIAALKAQAVPDRDIRTQGLNLQTDYAYAPNQPPHDNDYRRRPVSHK